MKNAKKIILVVFLLAVTVISLYFIFGRSKQKAFREAAIPKNLVSGKQSSGGTSPVAQTSGSLTSDTTTASGSGAVSDLLVLIQSISTVSLNGSLFERSDFKYLKDFNTGPKENTDVLLGGRRNPFLPYDPITNGTLVEVKQETPVVPTIKVTTLPPKLVKATEAVFTGTISGTTDSIYFEYGKNQATLDKKTNPVSPKTDGSLESVIVGLEANTTYFVRIVALPKGSTTSVSGDVITFKTTP